MDYLDSGVKLVQTVLPSAFQYFEKAKERDAKLTQTKEELAEARAHEEILVMQNHELKQSAEQVKVLTKRNQELLNSNANLEAFKNIVLFFLVVVGIVYVGMALSSEAA